MKLNDPVNIMLACCIPDKKKLMKEVSRLSPGDTVQIRIDNCVSSKAMVESYLKNHWCTIVKTEDGDAESILHIHMHGHL